MTKITRRAAGIVVVRQDNGRWLFLLLRAYRNWDFPKGLVESEETPIQAAIRETQEETSLTKLKFAWGEEYYETEPYAGGKIARYYLALTQQTDIILPVNPLLGKPEHHEYRWLNYEDARRVLSDRLSRVLDWANEKLD